MTDTPVRDLFDLPAQVGKTDFVLQLTSGVEQAQRTVDSYVITPLIVDSFSRALGVVQMALETGRSRAAYLHGSFGSGKSHFMAMLSLMLRGHEAPWRRTELHELRQKYGFIGKKNLLELHFHMIGRKSIEEAVLNQYVEYVGEHHPDAPVPPVFADEELFADARNLLNELGDEKFFAPLNEGKRATSGLGGFGSLWTRERFERCASSTDADERAKLFNELVKSRYTSFSSSSGAWVDFDTGLAAIATHAKSLGYDGIVLFLDELILWLSHGASQASWLHNEVQKMVKLVEGQDSARDVPIVSFIARQRNLAEMVGEQYAGADAARLADSLKHWEGRYDTIALEDRNLPTIIEKRVLRAKDDGAKSELDRAFAKLQQDAAGSWDTLIGQQDADAFRKTYPFSPALIEALVALSAFLQRERTAIRVLMEMLVEHVNDLSLGEVVRVGDLFDLLAGGEEATDGAMRTRFQAAKQLYKHQLLPLIQKSNGTQNPERCQRERQDHPIRLGCSNCAERQCRADNRLIKTLLIAALVPEVKSLKDLTAGRLHALNHGSLKTRIPGTEASQVAAKLRRWAAEIPQLRIGDDADPRVNVQLEGVDVGPIIEAHKSVDSEGARQRVLRNLLFMQMGIDIKSDSGRDHKEKWHNTDRFGHIRFGNVRTMAADKLRCPDTHDWRLIIDFPFDEAGHGPNDDLQVIDRFLSESSGTWTLVWLPSFLSQGSLKLLGELVVLEHLLSNSDVMNKAVAHLSVENQGRARLDLDNLHNQKRTRLVRILEQAYGLATPEEDTLDPGQMVERQLQLLQRDAEVPIQIAPNLAEALSNFIPALLDARYPRHPKLTKPLTNARVESLVASFGEIIDSPEKRIAADKSKADEASGTLGQLGLVRVTENAIHLVEDRTLQQIESKRNQAAVDEPNVAQVRRWIDETGVMGLQPAAMDLIVRCYARWANRTFVELDKPYEPHAKRDIPDEVKLEKPPLPSQAAWAKAYEVAGKVLGVSMAGRALHADNLKRFEAQVKEKVGIKSEAVTALPSALVNRAAQLGLPDEFDRLSTAKAADRLFVALTNKDAVQLVNVLAEAELASPKAVGESIATSVNSLACLRNELQFGVFRQLDARRSEIGGAGEILDEVVLALRQDELNSQLAPRLRALAEQGQRLLVPDEPPDVGPGPQKRRVLHRVSLSTTPNEARMQLQTALEQLDAALDASGDSARVSGSIEISVDES